MNGQNNEISSNKKDFVIPASIIIAGILIGGAVIYSTGLKNYNPEESKQSAKISSIKEKLAEMSKVKANDIDAVLGNANAPLEIIEFGDFQCSYCAKFYEEIEKPLKEKYVKTGKARLIYKPLAFLDSRSTTKESQNSVNAVKCAQEQGKFWEFHNALFDSEYLEVEKVLSGQIPSNVQSGNLNPELFKKISSDIGLNTNDFLSCYESGRHKDDYDIYRKEAEAAMPQGIGTPAIFINGEKVELQMTGERKFDFEKFSSLLDLLLQ